MFSIGGEKLAKRIPNRFVRTSGSARSKTLYLTFDDGPHPEITLKLCQLLDRYDAKGTFFCIGEHIEKYPEIARQLIASGHLLANHSHTHKEFKNLSLVAQMEEAERCQTAIRTLKPDSPNIFRAPQGKLSVPLLFKLISDKWHIVHWSYDSKDYRKGTLESQLEIFNNRAVLNGDVILFHDDNQVAIDLLEVLIPKWLNAGFKLETVEELVTS